MAASVASTQAPGRLHVVYTDNVARTDTSAKELFSGVRLNKGDIPLSLHIYSATASDAGTSALLSIGSTGNASYFAADIGLTEGYGIGQAFPSSVSNLMAPLPFDTAVTATYSEHGSASTEGGPWTVALEVLKV